MRDVTGLLQRAGRGDKAALDELVPHIYEELRGRAAAQMRREHPEHTLQTTALVHEAYLRLVDQNRADWTDRRCFEIAAASCIRRILVDHARRKQADKRAPRERRISLSNVAEYLPGAEVELLALDEALDRLARVDARKARAVELRYFTGLTNEAVADALGVSLGTVEGDLRFARAWLLREMQERGERP